MYFQNFNLKTTLATMTAAGALLFASVGIAQAGVEHAATVDHDTVAQTQKTAASTASAPPRGVYDAQTSSEARRAAELSTDSNAHGDAHTDTHTGHTSADTGVQAGDDYAQ